MPISWTQLASGAKIDLLSPDPEEIHLEDLLQGVAGIWRFNNALTLMPWSVLMHTINMTYVAAGLLETKQTCKQILFHDLHEAIIGDITTSMKNAVPQIRGVDIIVQRAVFAKFSIPHPYGDIVKDLDMKAARWEAEAGFTHIRDEWTKKDLPRLTMGEEELFNKGKRLAKLDAENLKKLWHKLWQECRA